MPALTPLHAPSPSDVDPSDGPQRRVEPRSNIYVVAALASDSGNGPVRIRNMSRSGALVEGALIPPDGSAVRLSRGSLSISGEVVWRHESRAGMRFDSAVTVAAWLPGGKSAAGQQRIDEIVYSYKAEVGAMTPAASAAPSPVVTSRQDIGWQLLDVRDALNAVAEELAGDDATMARHPNALQAIDMAAQKLETLARPRRSDAPGLAL